MRRYIFAFSALACEDISFHSVLWHAKIYFYVQCSCMRRSILCIQCSGIRRSIFAFSALACEDIIFAFNALACEDIIFCIQCSVMRRYKFCIQGSVMRNYVFAFSALACEDNFLLSTLACRIFFAFSALACEDIIFCIQCSGMRRYDCVTCTNAKCTFLKNSIFYAFKIRRSTLHVLSNKEFKRHLCDHIMSHSFFKEMKPVNKTFQVNNN